MRTRIENLWYSLYFSFWFVPAAMTVAAIALSYLIVRLDQALGYQWMAGPNLWAYSGGPEGARQVLATIAGSMITVAGVVFSITIVALVMAGSQLGPRLIRSFMDDKGTQLVLGTFLATFVYCLLVLRTVRSETDSSFVPYVALNAGILLTLVSLAVLIYFIHHVASSIQADNVIASVSLAMEDSIARLLPDRPQEAPARNEERAATLDGDGAWIQAPRSGYLQAIELETLLELAQRHDLVIRIEPHPGSFVIRGQVLAIVWPKTAAKHREELSEPFILGSHRTPTQDLEYYVNRLVEMAVRALSPGVNDPFTAMTCIDRLSSALVQIGQRPTPPASLAGDDGTPRLLLAPVRFEHVTASAFDMIRNHARRDPAVLHHLLESLDDIARLGSGRQGVLATLREHVERLRATAQSLPDEERIRLLQACDSMLAEPRWH